MSLEVKDIVGYGSINGSYLLQPNKTNGRNWYMNGNRAIWWDGDDDWWIGSLGGLGQERGYAYLKKDVSIPIEILSANWRVYNGSNWLDGDKNLNVSCGVNASNTLETTFYNKVQELQQKIRSLESKTSNHDSKIRSLESEKANIVSI